MTIPNPNVDFGRFALRDTTVTASAAETIIARTPVA